MRCDYSFRVLERSEAAELATFEFATRRDRPTFSDPFSDSAIKPPVLTRLSILRKSYL